MGEGGEVEPIQRVWSELLLGLIQLFTLATVGKTNSTCCVLVTLHNITCVRYKQISRLFNKFFIREAICWECLWPEPHSN